MNYDFEIHRKTHRFDGSYSPVSLEDYERPDYSLFEEMSWDMEDYGIGRLIGPIFSLLTECDIIDANLVPEQCIRRDLNLRIFRIVVRLYSPNEAFVFRLSSLAPIAQSWDEVVYEEHSAKI
jgi:hypothetical protein